MEAFPRLVHVPKHAEVVIRPELAPILSLEMVARDVWEYHSKHAIPKLVKVGEETFVANFSFFVFNCILLRCCDCLDDDINRKISSLCDHSFCYTSSFNHKGILW